ncbi:hypothetical protein [Paraburkholderia silvatlantica]|uniref:hypothetical protein n=1 Tax=Paraburkholderia silvatlantica TaxID=321895 RepID=UPI0037511F94
MNRHVQKSACPTAAGLANVIAKAGDFHMAATPPGVFPQRMHQHTNNSRQIISKTIRAAAPQGISQALDPTPGCGITEGLRPIGQGFELFLQYAYWYSHQYLKKIPQINLITYTCAQVWMGGSP